MLKSPLTALVLLPALYLGVCTVLYFLQRSMLYYPTPAVTAEDAEVLWLDSEGRQLKIWHLPQDTTRAILYFGGNAEDVALNLPQFRRLFPDHAVYLMNYSGYGGSSGSPSEENLFADTLALYDKVAQHQADVTVIGRSLGTGVAVYLAAERPLQQLVLVTPFDSMVNLAVGIYPFLPVRFLLRDRYDSLSRITTLNSVQTLVLVAEDDEVIPRQRTDALIAAMPPNTTRVTVIAATGHNTIGTSPHYARALSDFINSTSREQREGKPYGDRHPSP